MILITTAGNVGSETAALLGHTGVPTRILVRDRTRFRALERAGVDLVTGDLDDPTTVEAAVDGVDSVVLVSPAIPAQELRVVDAAAQSGVQHIVKVTSKGLTRLPDRPPTRAE